MTALLPRLNDLVVVFISIVLQSLPFVLVGVFASVLVQQYLSERLVLRWMPRRALRRCWPAACSGWSRGSATAGRSRLGVGWRPRACRTTPRSPLSWPRRSSTRSSCWRRRDFGGVDAVECLGDRELGDAHVLHRTVGTTPRHHVPLRSDRGGREQSARRPTYGDASRLVTSAWNGWVVSYSGAGMSSSRISKSGLRPSAPATRSTGGRGRRVDRRAAGAGVAVHDGEADLVLVGVEVEEQLLHLVRRPRRRASLRSTLFTTRITGRRASRALRSTKRVCGSGPSAASTSSSTPSTIVRPARPRRRSRRGRACRRC